MEGAQWKLAISHFKNEEQALKVEIKMETNPFDTKKAKDYFKKKDFFLPSNIANNNAINPLNDLDDEDENEEDAKARKKQQD